MIVVMVRIMMLVWLMIIPMINSHLDQGPRKALRRQSIAGASLWLWTVACPSNALFDQSLPTPLIWMNLLEVIMYNIGRDNGGRSINGGEVVGSCSSWFCWWWSWCKWLWLKMILVIVEVGAMDDDDDVCGIVDSSCHCWWWWCWWWSWCKWLWIMMIVEVLDDE